MSKYVPDDLKNMSKKELLEVALIMHEENVKLNAELKRESMELRSRLGAALSRNSEYNEAIENMQQKLAKANERLKELEKENALLKEHKHDEYYAERNWNELHGDES